MVKQISFIAIVAVGMGALIIGSTLAQTTFAMFPRQTNNIGIKQTINQENDCKGGFVSCTNVAVNNVNFGNQFSNHRHP